MSSTNYSGAQNPNAIVSSHENMDIAPQIYSNNEENEDDDMSNFKSEDSSVSCNNGRWNQSEHYRFIKGCILYGNNWKRVKECVKTRSSAQIRSHAQKYIIKLCKKFNVRDKNNFKHFRLIQKEVERQNIELFNALEDSSIDKISNKDMERLEGIIQNVFKSHSTSTIENERFNDEKVVNNNIQDTNNNHDEAQAKPAKVRVFQTVKVKRKKQNVQQTESNETRNKLLNKSISSKKSGYNKPFFPNINVEHFESLQNFPNLNGNSMFLGHGGQGQGQGMLYPFQAPFYVNPGLNLSHQNLNLNLLSSLLNQQQSNHGQMMINEPVSNNSTSNSNNDVQLINNLVNIINMKSQSDNSLLSVFNPPQQSNNKNNFFSTQSLPSLSTNNLPIMSEKTNFSSTKNLSFTNEEKGDEYPRENNRDRDSAPSFRQAYYKNFNYNNGLLGNTGLGLNFGLGLGLGLSNQQFQYQHKQTQSTNNLLTQQNPHQSQNSDLLGLLTLLTQTQQMTQQQAQQALNNQSLLSLQEDKRLDQLLKLASGITDEGQENKHKSGNFERAKSQEFTYGQNILSNYSLPIVKTESTPEVNPESFESKINPQTIKNSTNTNGNAWNSSFDPNLVSALGDGFKLNLNTLPLFNSAGNNNHNDQLLNFMALSQVLSQTQTQNQNLSQYLSNNSFTENVNFSGTSQLNEIGIKDNRDVKEADVVISQEPANQLNYNDHDSAQLEDKNSGIAQSKEDMTDL